MDYILNKNMFWSSATLAFNVTGKLVQSKDWLGQDQSHLHHGMGRGQTGFGSQHHHFLSVWTWVPLCIYIYDIDAYFLGYYTDLGCLRSTCNIVGTWTWESVMPVLLVKAQMLPSPWSRTYFPRQTQSVLPFCFASTLFHPFIISHIALFCNYLNTYVSVFPFWTAAPVHIYLRHSSD